MKLSQYFCYQQSILVPPSCRPYREPPPHQPCCTHHEKRTSYCLMSNRKSITIKDASAHAVVVKASQCNIDICSMTLGQVRHSLKPSLLCRVRPNQQSSRRRNPRAERKNPDLNHGVEATLLISTTLKVQLQKQLTAQELLQKQSTITFSGIYLHGSWLLNFLIALFQALERLNKSKIACMDTPPLWK